ncbi:hypothetical protein ETAA8_51350 [Anatilimnocola aggregata]|uniref:Uncharacterized protein n=1 Tax=Anatilimnocola aggregata TaxID=2528021 RepID=A0A517YIG3_9BACT|nr:hypothetical protein ETAA8_51350 [Anatilimnocola aggregata]
MGPNWYATSRLTRARDEWNISSSKKHRADSILKDIRRQGLVGGGLIEITNLSSSSQANTISKWW